MSYASADTTRSTFTAQTAPGTRPARSKKGVKVAEGDSSLVFDADFVPDAEHHQGPDPPLHRRRGRHGAGALGSPQPRLLDAHRVQSMMLDGHFVIEHIARNRSGRFFNFNGTAGMWRKQTIIDAGGWQHDTFTEDMDLSFRAQLKGWRFVYVPDALAPAEIPCEMNSFKTQQFRWAKGSAQTAKKLLPDCASGEAPAPHQDRGALPPHQQLRLRLLDRARAAAAPEHAAARDDGYEPRAPAARRAAVRGHERLDRASST